MTHQILGAVLAGAAASVAYGQTSRAVVSRFSESAEGWTLEGPGQLAWMAGGFLEVTRTGAGDLYLVAPPAFHGEWGSPLPPQFVDPRVSLNYFVSGPGADRSLVAELSGPVGTATGATAAFIVCGGLPAWIPVTPRQWSVAGSWPTTVTAMRIRIDHTSANPVGEVFQVDDISLRRCVPNCDGSTVAPVLNINDFICFINAYVVRDPYANFEYFDNCLHVGDFIDFLNAYASGCP